MTSEESTLVIKPEISTHLDLLVKQFDLEKNPFFKEIRHGVDNSVGYGAFYNGKKTIPLNREQLYRRFVPFYHAVAYWVVHLRAVRDTLPEKEADLLSENINDESGFNGGKLHTETYIEFLNSLSSEEKLSNSSDISSGSGVEQFIHNLRLLFKKNNVFHISALAGIEYFYVFISNFFVEHLKPYINGKQEHYVQHEEIDKKHAADLITIANSLNKQSDDKLILDGLEHGFSLLNDLYHSLILTC